MECENCGDSFNPKFQGQKVCVKCYYEENPEKNYAKQHRDRLYSAIGRPREKKQSNWHSHFIPTDEQIGICDGELLNDEDYIQQATKSNQDIQSENLPKSENGKGTIKNSDGSIKGNSLLKLRFSDKYSKTSSKGNLKRGDILPDGSVFVGQRKDFSSNNSVPIVEV